MAIKSACLRMSPTVTWMRAVFEELDSVVRKFIEIDEEPPYWNNEAASISLIVAAAARKGSLALSDYRRSKQHGGKAKGRCDLFIIRGTKYLEIEAKQTYISHKTSMKTIRKKLAKARQAANALWWTHKTRRAGLLFAVFGLSADQAKTFDPKRLISELKKLKIDLIWFWYDTAAHQPVYRFKGNDRYYPGLLILLKH